MAESFDTTFTFGQAAEGLLAADGFTGTSVLGLLTTTTITGTVTNPGDPVSVTTSVLGAVPVTVSGTYQGFSIPTGGTEPVYYFNLAPIGAQTPVAVAVTKGTLPAVGVLTPVTGGEAPNSDLIVCYVTGTRISTVRGEVAVEDLQVGDLAVTSSGEHRPIRWLGHQTISCRRHRRSADVLPVRIAAGAFGENKPAQDLLISPGHAVCFDVLGEVLVLASALVNGTTITQDQVEEVTYWHVELDSHDILIANGQPAESYLDMGNRSFFTGDDVVSLATRPDLNTALRTHADYCRPFHMTGAIVDAVRARVQARAEQLRHSAAHDFEAEGQPEPMVAAA